MNAGRFIDFLREPFDSVPGKVFLIVDGRPTHKAKKVSEFVREKADKTAEYIQHAAYS